LTHYAREEVPEVLNITPATVIPGNAVAEVDAAQAAMRPLAGFGAGAFTCDGAFVGSRANEMAASSALPPVRGAFAATGMHHVRPDGVVGGYQPAAVSTGTVSTGTVSTGTVSTSTVSTSTVSIKQLNLMARINPVTPGGVGSHPAREPDPV
jgi:hypothetical protein